MDELHIAIGEAHSRSTSLEVEPVLIRLLSKAFLHLFECVAKLAQTRHKVISQVEAQLSISRRILTYTSAEIPLIAAFEGLRAFIQFIVEIRSQADATVDGKDLSGHGAG